MFFLYSAVHLARFSSSGIHLFSGSDDKTVRLWDAATESELHCFSDHQVIIVILKIVCYFIPVNINVYVGTLQMMH